MKILLLLYFINVQVIVRISYKRSKMIEVAISLVDKFARNMICHLCWDIKKMISFGIRFRIKDTVKRIDSRFT